MEISEAISRLREAGVNVTPTGPDTVRTDDGVPMLVRKLAKAPGRRTVEHDLSRTEDHLLLYILGTTPRKLDRLTSDPRVAVVSPGAIWYGKDLTETPAMATKAIGRGPRPYTKFAVARALLAPERLPQTMLAARFHVSQPAVSNAVAKLADEVPPRTTGDDHGALFDYALTRYPGPGGITTYWWRDDPLDQQAATILEADAGALLSGDLAARQISAWRVPEHATVYTVNELNPAALGFAAATADDYTLSITVPADTTLWATSKLHHRPGTADPVIVAHDILNTGTTGDQDEAAGMIRAATLRLLPEQR
ncbi:hypothetical protein [Agromyces italicus]|uniref:hypothetical protein n=1 Tax=Agromyces italicus TaxID=279572 RepID=UPI0003B58031|nr:hypothetical protein [Agromyces italicus]